MIMARYLRKAKIFTLAWSLWALALTVGGAAGQTSQWVFVGPDGQLIYNTLPDGDRIMDFSSAGYMGGGVSLPNPPVRRTVSPAGKDDTAAIQAAIDAVSSLNPDADGFRGTVLLTPGTFNCRGTLNITTSGVVLRGSGSGPDGTILNMTGNPHRALNLQGSGSWQTVGPSAAMTDPYVPSGSLSFNVDSAAGFNIGDTILIRRPVTAAWVHFMGMDRLVRSGRPQTWLSIGSTIQTDRVIQAISENTITLDVPLTDSFDSQFLDPPGGTIIRYNFPGRIAQVGVEHLSIVAPPVDVDISRPQFTALSLSAVIDAWVQDLAIQDTQNSISVSNSAKQVTIDTTSVTHTIAHSGSAAPADFSISGTQILVNLCSVTGRGVWPIVTQARVTGPIAVLNFTGSERGFAPHQRWATGLLCDGCQFPGATSGTPGIAYSNRGTAGSGHGWAAGWAVAWNVSSPFLLVQEPPGSENWCIGCVGTPLTRPMPGGDGTPLPNGIYDSLGTPVTPSSLYLAQMCERLGPAAVADIGYEGSCGDVAR